MHRFGTPVQSIVTLEGSSATILFRDLRKFDISS